jgi:hypothetical protein
MIVKTPERTISLRRFPFSAFLKTVKNSEMSPLKKYRTMMRLLVLMACTNGFLVFYGDMSQGSLRVFVAFSSVLIVGLAVYSQFMIRCPRCSNRITASARDGKARGSANPPQNCRFCGYGLG